MAQGSFQTSGEIVYLPRRRRSGSAAATGGTATILLSANTVLDNASINTVIGAFSVVGGTGSYTFTLTSNPGALFNISGSNLRVNASLVGNLGLKPITVKADNGAGSVITQNFNVLVNSSAGFALKADYSLANNEALFLFYL